MELLAGGGRKRWRATHVAAVLWPGGNLIKRTGYIRKAGQVLMGMARLGLVERRQWGDAPPFYRPTDYGLALLRGSNEPAVLPRDRWPGAVQAR